MESHVQKLGLMASGMWCSMARPAMLKYVSYVSHYIPMLKTEQAASG